MRIHDSFGAGRRSWTFAATALAAIILSTTLHGEIRRDPNGVNVSSQGATTVFITFGGLNDQVPVEATWCGELIPAAPDLGLKCDPATVFGSRGADEPGGHGERDDCCDGRRCDGELRESALAHPFDATGG